VIDRKIIMAIAIVAILILGFILAYFIMQMSNPSEPFPSENTPLSKMANGIKWTQNFPLNLTRDMWFHITIDDEDNYTSWFIGVYYSSNQTFQFVPTSNPLNLSGVSLTLNVIDANNNENYDIGDSFTITMPDTQDFLQDTIYTITLSYTNGILFYPNDYCFAIHDDIFYTWDPKTPHIIL